ncbi:intermembrane phospholipid transport protein YdbH family protein [Sphingomonas mucosissima]|uniref:intermembrane phospholipid transport protein YdbH family protein n=1 Tax=Sphingomonas mucosissima TaxID=370959 RepID=UPI001FEAF366|nr:YdbH domain-containing protein [Sphingomonas mucosissima]
MLLGVAALLAALWFTRVPIATRFIDRSFAASGVEARYRIEDLGLRWQRLTDVVIGDPRDPDLVADWVETRLAMVGGKPTLTAVRAGRVRLRGSLTDGRLSLGALDRLMPAPSGKPFALPPIDLSVADARMRLSTAMGVIGLRLSGRGRLDDGFRGTLAAVTENMSVGGCALRRPTALLNIAVRDAAPKITGPVRVRALSCSGVAVAAPEARVDVALGAALERWEGSAALRTGAITGGAVQLRSLAGQVSFTGTPARTEGDAQVRGEALNAAPIRGGAVLFAGTWRVAAGRALAAGRVEGRDLALAPPSRARLVRAADGVAGTPLAPLAAAATRAAATAAERFDLAGEMAIGTAAGRPLLTMRQMTLHAASGASVSFGDGAGLVLGEKAGLRAEGALRFGGGGLPTGRVELVQSRVGGPVSGTVSLARYAAGTASLEITPARFAFAPAGDWRLTTVATITGPLGGSGSVEALRIPLDVRANHAGIMVDPSCVPASFRALSISGLRLRPAQLTLCPLGGGLVRVAGGRLDGGVQIEGARLAGALGGSPLTLALADARWRHAEADFALAGVSARLGRPGSVTRLDFGRLQGRMVGGAAIAGTFAEGAGQVGNVPLLLSGAQGGWRFVDNILTLSGGLTVADAAASPRFTPLSGRDVSLQLAGNVINAKGTLFEPAKGVRVAEVTIRHALATGAGAAHLAVPGITFGDGFQPEELTRLTYGVIADVRGTVRGRGDIAWTPDGVTSRGTFGTDNTDLAAAFGPVRGIKGEVHFADLLALESAPGQIATVAEINPGVPVTDGRIEYQLLRDLRIAVKGGRWPFGGGTLTLQPTLLDFSSPQERHLTFRADGVEVRQFLQQFDFKNLDATGVFDGELPMIFDQSGGRIENGRLVVREGGGTLAYLGELTKEDLGTWGNIAFQALRSLRYRNLELVMNGPLAGDMVTEVRFAGVSQGEGAKSNFLVRRLQRLPFVFNIRIQAPFRSLIDTAASFYDPKRLVERNLPALLEEQNKRAAPPTIQPPASENMP